jgi:hypothetical protein
MNYIKKLFLIKLWVECTLECRTECIACLLSLFSLAPHPPFLVFVLFSLLEVEASVSKLASFCLQLPSFHHCPLSFFSLHLPRGLCAIRRPLSLLKNTIFSLPFCKPISPSFSFFLSLNPERHATFI